MAASIHRQRRIIDDCVLTLNGAELLDVIRGTFSFSVIPKDAKIVCRIPSGGDYSSMELGIDNDAPIIITWTETRSEGIS